MIGEPLQSGDRIRISATYHWAQGATGTIDYPPEVPRLFGEEDGAPWDGVRHFVKGRKGLIEFYWVWFDVAQDDPDGDGPYQGCEIEAWALEKLD